MIDRKLKDIGKDLDIYIRKEIGKLKPDLEKMSFDCGEKVERRPCLPLDTLKIIEEIAKKTKTPVSTIITKWIIDPLLES